MQAIYAIPIAFLTLVVAYIVIHVLEKTGINRVWRVRMILNRLDKGQYHVYHDIHIPIGKKRMARVDHLVTSRYGIILIGTRNYGQWKAGSIKALENYLGIDKRFFSTIYAIHDKSKGEFKGDVTFAKAVDFSKLLKTINAYQWKVIGEERLQKINEKLDRLIISSKNREKKTRNEKVQPIHSGVQQAKIISFERTKCPVCHSDLKRSRNYGDGMKCRKESECKHRKNITG